MWGFRERGIDSEDVLEEEGDYWTLILLKYIAIKLGDYIINNIFEWDFEER